MSELKYIYVNDSNANKIGIKSSIKSRTYHTVQAMRSSSYIEAILFFFFFGKKPTSDRRHWQNGGARGHGGKLQREDYRQLGYQATISLLALVREPSTSFESSLSFDALVT